MLDDSHTSAVPPECAVSSSTGQGAAPSEASSAASEAHIHGVAATAAVESQLGGARPLEDAQRGTAAIAAAAAHVAASGGGTEIEAAVAKVQSASSPPSQLAAAQAALEVARVALDNAQAAEEKARRGNKEHTDTHYAIANEVSKLTGLAQYFLAQYGDGGVPPNAELRSLPLIHPVCFDDKSSFECPHTNTSGTEITSKYSFSVNGQCRLDTECGTMLCQDSSCSNKSTDVEMNQLLINLLVEGRGERVLFLLSDCGPLNYNAAIALLFAMFLTDLGLYDMVIIGYLQRYHSKQLCDRLFGLIQELLKLSDVLSLELFGELVETITSNSFTKEKIKFLRVNPWAMSKFKEFLAQLYRTDKGAAPHNFFFDEQQRHWYCAVREGALEDAGFLEMLDMEVKVFENMAPFSLRSIIGKIIPEKPGFIGGCYRLDEDYRNVDFYYCRKENPTVLDLSALPLFEAVSTASERKSSKAEMPRALSSSTAPSASRSACVEELFEAEAPGESTSQLLKENENTIKKTGYASSNLVKYSQIWRASLARLQATSGHASGSSNLAAGGGGGSSSCTWPPRPGWNSCQALGNNWIGMGAREAKELGLAPMTQVLALVGSESKVQLTDSPAVPLAAAQGASCESIMEEFGKAFGGNDKSRMMCRVTVGHLLKFIAERDARLSALDEAFSHKLKLSYNPDFGRAFEHHLKQQTRETLQLPTKPMNNLMIFRAERKLQGAVPEPTILKEWAAFKEANDGAGVYEEKASEQKWEYREKHENWLKSHHSKEPLPAPWSDQAVAAATSAARNPPAKKQRVRAVSTSSSAATSTGAI